MSPETWTILKVLNWTTEHFAARGIPTPRLDAEVLLAHVLECRRIDLYVRFDQPLERPELDRFKDLVRRRLAGEPVAYLTGVKEFWSLPLRVDRRVLIPRPETELLVEVALELTSAAAAPGVLCDVGTGSGAVACVLKKERPAWRVLATDVSAAALEVARDNAARLGLAIEFLEGDLLAPLAGRGPLDLIVCNPPYLGAAELPGLMREVREHEPHVALTPGTDALAALRRLVAEAPPLLAPGGALALEIAAGQAATVTGLFAAAGAYEEPTVRRDLAGHERVVFARRAG